MKKFIIRASETVYYWKEVRARDIVYYMIEIESESEEKIKDLIRSGDVMFDNEDIVDEGDFELVDIEEIK